MSFRCVPGVEQELISLVRSGQDNRPEGLVRIAATLGVGSHPR